MTAARSSHAQNLASVMNLMRKWKISVFRPGQHEAINAALADSDSLIVMPTGGGKSFCYQAPAACESGMTLVVSPLISLMKDQVDALNARGVPAAAVNSTIHWRDANVIYGRAKRGELQLLYVAPERLDNPEFLTMLTQADVRAIVVDEAHCISQWGHDFRPAYSQIAKLRRILPNARMSAFTATATQEVIQEIAQKLELRDPVTFVGDFDRPNLTLDVRLRSKSIIHLVDDMIAITVRWARKTSSQTVPGIVYVITRAQANAIAEHLRDAGLNARPYHAGLDDDERTATQAAFMADELDVVVATIAFGMGINKPNVRYVIHASMPSSIEVYHQEIGRAGRDGRPADCVLFWHEDDVAVWQQVMAIDPALAMENIRAQRLGPDESKLVALNQMLEFCEQSVCRHAALVEHFAQRYPGDDCGACDVCISTASVSDRPVSTTKAQRHEVENDA